MQARASLGTLLGGKQEISIHRVSVLQLNRQAHVALGTVEESVTTADSAYPAAVAVILILILVVEQIAFEARVFAEPTVAVLASGLYRLAGVAQHAYQLRNFFSVHRVRLLFIVAESTRVHFVAAGRLETININYRRSYRLDRSSD